MYKSGLKHRDTDCLSRDPVESAPAGTDDSDDEESILGALNVDDMAALQRNDPELRALIEHLARGGRRVPRVFSQALASFAEHSRLNI